MTTPRTTTRTITFNGRDIHYQLEKKNVKNLNLRIHKDGNVYVSAGEQVPLQEIDEFIISKGNYILKAIDTFAEMEAHSPQPKQYISGETFYIQGRGLRLKVLPSNREAVFADGIYIHLETKEPDNFEKKQRAATKFLNQQCKTVFNEILNELYPQVQKYGVSAPALRIRDMETRWGSCSFKRGFITLNKRLLEAPRYCIEYVIMHELCHFVHPNHSKRFYDFLTMLMPDWKDRKQALDRSATYWL